MEPFGPNNEFIIDYSVYDAKKAGFNKIVFVIKEEMYEDFKNTIGKRVEKHIKVEYAFQRMENIPVNKKYNRIKPWGTAHALYAAREKITDSFVIINSDDYYGKESYKLAYDYLSKADSCFGIPSGSWKSWDNSSNR